MEASESSGQMVLWSSVEGAYHQREAKLGAITRQGR